jgi:hypothetical protein
LFVFFLLFVIGPSFALSLSIVVEVFNFFLLLLGFFYWVMGGNTWILES